MQRDTWITALRKACAVVGLVVAPWLPGVGGAATHCGPSFDSPGMQRCVSGLSAAVLAQMHETQKASQWCWAASISMVLRRYGSSVSQEQIVRAYFGEPANNRVSDDTIFQLLNRKWQDATGRAFHASAGPLPKWRRHLGLGAPEVLADLEEGRPLVVGVQEHAMVLVQLVYERPIDEAARTAGIRLLRAVVLDPASEAGIRTLRNPERMPGFVARVAVEADAPVHSRPPALAAAGVPVL